MVFDYYNLLKISNMYIIYLLFNSANEFHDL